MRKTYIIISFMLTVQFILVAYNFYVGDKKIVFKKQREPEKRGLYNQDFSTTYSDSETFVLQILPELDGGKIAVNGKKEKRKYAIFFIPNAVPGKPIWSPLNYIQENFSFPQKWIKSEDSEKYALKGIDKIKKVILTKKIKEKEEVINIPQNYTVRLLTYLKYDILNNPNGFIGFDCFAFISLLANVNYHPSQPEFDYKEKDFKVGDFVVLANSRLLPDSIRHWALFLGDDLYLSKFGRSGDGAQSLLCVTDLKSMMALYGCKFVYAAYPKTNAKRWTGYNNPY